MIYNKGTGAGFQYKIVKVDSEGNEFCFPYDTPKTSYIEYQDLIFQPKTDESQNITREIRITPHYNHKIKVKAVNAGGSISLANFALSMY